MNRQASSLHFHDGLVWIFAVRCPPCHQHHLAALLRHAEMCRAYITPGAIQAEGAGQIKHLASYTLMPCYSIRSVEAEDDFPSVNNNVISKARSHDNSKVRLVVLGCA